MHRSKKEEIVVKVRKKVLDKISYMEDVSDDELEIMIAGYLSEASRDNYLPLRERIEMGKEIFQSMRKLDILQNLIDDAEITEIMINGPKVIFVEKEGRLIRLNNEFESEEKLKNIIQQIVAKCNRVVNDASPIVDARLENGSRVNVVLNPVAINGPILTIRRFPEMPFTMEKLVHIGALSVEVAEFLKKVVIAGYNIVISGGTGSGKTTFLNALSGYIPKDERIITIEDSAELQIQGVENLVRLETKNANTENSKEITIRDLIKASLRMRPNRVIVGEVRGVEAMDMVCSAMNCGHDGSMSTIHANSAKDGLLRLETMILMATPLPVSAIRRQISSGVDIIIHLGRLRDQSRRVLQIIEMDGMIGDEIQVHELFCFQEEGENERGKIIGRLQKRGELIHDYKMLAAGQS